jgi:hypothetical protein
VRLCMRRRCCYLLLVVLPVETRDASACQVIPNAFRWYTGEACDSEDDDDVVGDVAEGDSDSDGGVSTRCSRARSHVCRPPLSLLRHMRVRTRVIHRCGVGVMSEGKEGGEGDESMEEGEVVGESDDIDDEDEEEIIDETADIRQALKEAFVSKKKQLATLAATGSGADAVVADSSAVIADVEKPEDCKQQ